MTLPQLLIVMPYPLKSGIFGAHMKGYLDQYKLMGYSVITEKIYFWERKLYYSIKWFLLMKYFIRKDIVIILHQHTIPASGPMIIPFLFFARLFRKKVITVSHETIQTYAKHLPDAVKWVAYLYEKMNVMLSAYYVVHTSFHRDEIKSIIDTPKLKVIPLPVVGVNIIEKERKFWGFYGMVSPKKGVDLLLDAYQTFSPGTLPPLRIMGAAAPGEDEYFESCKRLVRTEFTSLIYFSGMVLDEEKSELFSQTSLMILPYRYVSQSGVIAETCIYKIPYLASDLQFFKEFNRTFGCGELFVTNDKASLQEKLHYIIKNPLKISDSELLTLKKELLIEHCAAAFGKLISY